MSPNQFHYLNMVHHPYKPGFERFTYTFKQQSNGTEKELIFNIRISDTLIGQWDLEELQELKKAMFLYIVRKYLKTAQSQDIELNAYQTSSPNQFPYKTEMNETTFPPTQPILLNE
jgi:hypothetical protein